MAVTVSIKKVTGAMLLNNGSTSTGAVKTKSIRIGGTSQNISTSAYTTDLAASRQKVLNISEAAAPCLAKSIYMVKETTENELS